MAIKFYDKFLDLIGRDGLKIVGSRFNQIVGESNNLDLLQSKVRAAQESGMTRVEISYYFNDQEDYRFS